MTNTIHHIQPAITTSAWQRELARGPRQVGELLNWLELPADTVPDSLLNSAFPLRVPPGFVARMRKNDPQDPLLRQVLPTTTEEKPAPGFRADPVGDTAAISHPGLIHKYHGRALIMTTGACAIHCRYCFRRHFPYQDQSLHGQNWQQTIDTITGSPDIHEIILSGGDPLMLPDKRLFALADALLAIPQIRRLRWHTRLPVVLPERIDTAFLKRLASLQKPQIFVIHCNHPQELDDRVRRALRDLGNTTGVTLLNQSVLLKGINDSATVLGELSERLFDAGVLPYYLHQLDRVQGAAHFEVRAATAVAIQRALRARLPGYLVPHLVQEIAGQPVKMPLVE